MTSLHGNPVEWDKFRHFSDLGMKFQIFNLNKLTWMPWEEDWLCRRADQRRKDWWRRQWSREPEVSHFDWGPRWLSGCLEERLWISIIKWHWICVMLCIKYWNTTNFSSRVNCFLFLNLNNQGGIADPNSKYATKYIFLMSIANASHLEHTYHCLIISRKYSY